LAGFDSVFMHPTKITLDSFPFNNIRYLCSFSF